MGAKAIPEVGQRFLGDKPATRKLLHVSFGVSSASPDVTVAETATYQLVDITVPAVITALWTQVEEAFTSSVTATIGDSDGADRYIADTTINPASSGAILVSATGLTVPYVTPSSPLDIEVVIGGATVAAGLAHVYVEYYELQD
jgi:hypothetical protein